MADLIVIDNGTCKIVQEKVEQVFINDTYPVDVKVIRYTAKDWDFIVTKVYVTKNAKFNLDTNVFIYHDTQLLTVSGTMSVHTVNRMAKALELE